QKAKPASVATPATDTKPPNAAAVTTPSEPSGSRSIALFFDDAHASMLGVRKSAEAAERLITNTLATTDLVGLFTSSRTGLVDFTSSHQSLIAALAKLDAHPLRGVHTGPCPTLNGEEAFIFPHHADIGIEEAAVKELVGCNCPPLSEQ